MKEKSTKMSMLGCITMSIGAIIGAGLFTALPMGITMVGNKVGWALIAAAVFICMKTLPSLYLQSSLPISGGSYVYMARFIHPSVAFVQSLNACIGMFNIAVMSITFAAYFVQLFPGANLNKTVVAVGCALVFAALGTFGAKFTGTVQNVIVAILLAALSVYIFGGIGRVNHAVVAPDFLAPTANFFAVWGAVAILNYALQGGSVVASFADEVENPGKTIPQSFFIGTGVVTVIYILIAYVTCGLGPIPGKTGIEAYNLGALAAGFLPPWLVTFFIVAGALFATITTLNGSFMIYSRLFYVSARDKVWPAVFAKTNRYKVPYVALWFCTLCSVVVMVAGVEITQLLRVVSIPGLLLGILFYYPPMVFAKKFPNAAKRSYIHINPIVNKVLCVLSILVSFYMGQRLLFSLNRGLAIAMVSFYAAGYVYYFIRKAYLAKRGIDMLSAGKTTPAVWEERNRPFEPEKEQPAEAK